MIGQISVMIEHDVFIVMFHRDRIVRKQKTRVPPASGNKRKTLRPAAAAFDANITKRLVLRTLRT